MKYPFRDYEISFSGADDNILHDIILSKLMQNWLSSIDDSIILKSIKIQNYARGDSKEFSYIKLDTISTRFGLELPRIIILDGFAITVLPIFVDKETKEEYAILVHKVVITTGGFRYVVPSSIINGEMPSPEYAAHFLTAQCGITEHQSHFINLIEKTVNDKYDAIYPFCGPSDQKNFIYLMKKETELEEIMNYDNKEISPNVHLCVVPYDHCMQYICDMISISSFLFYNQYKKI